MKSARSALLLLLSLALVPAAAQYYQTGQEPSSIKWMQIKTDKFRVIYPESYGSQGIEFTRALEDAYSGLMLLYPEMKFRIPVIIHNHTTTSNGYVAWAPYRMEIYPTPEQNSIPLDPKTQLAIHELTHVFQMKSLDKGFTRVMSYITGQQFNGAVAALLPLWFLEGDAVFSETLLTGSGRGRTPSFQKPLKALMLEKGKIYKYDKIVNGSFRDFVPNHYYSGYQMMAWSYAKYDSALWKKALNLTANLPFTLNPVNLSLRANASLTKKRLFRETFDTLQVLWTAEDSALGSVEYDIVNPPKGKKYINYYSPVRAGKDSIIAVRTSLDHPPSFVLIRPAEGRERRIHTPGYSYPWNISYARGKIVWVESDSDPRWRNRTWSVIKILDLKSGTTRKLSGKTRYMAAAISPDASRIAAVRSSITQESGLVIIDAADGSILGEIPAPPGVWLQKPQWDEKGNIITFVSLSEEGEGIMSFDLRKYAWKIHISPSSNDIQSAFTRNDSLFFVSSASGTDNVYLLAGDGKISRLTKSRFGVSDLNISGNNIMFADYSTSGNNICQASLRSEEPDTAAFSENPSYLINRFRPYDGSSGESQPRVFLPEPYKKWKNLFRFHSWMPFYASIDEITSDPALIKPGITLMTQNNLSTLISTIGYEYADNRHMLHARINWLGWYPALESVIDYGYRPVIEKLGENVPDPAEYNQGMAITNTLYLPLYFQSGKFSEHLRISASWKYINDHIYMKNSGYYDPGQSRFTGRIYFSNYYRTAVRDIYPRWAQTMDLSYSAFPFDRELYGDLATLKTAFYFPGLSGNHGLRVRLEKETQNPERFLQKNLISFSRGYDNIISKRADFVSADYYMPLFYPDFNLSSFLYLTRIRADLFFDYTHVTDHYRLMRTDNGMIWFFTEGKMTFRSFGAQLLGDFFIFRIPYMVSAGVEAAWREPGTFPVIRLLFNMDIYGMSIGRNRTRAYNL
ncbi:MAG TPA: hypothetical protein PKL65_07005 [Bacteroidales bacterium]|nr:hypothetical protein [Bacteroidales bacterium]HNR41965.1 hypothetical protein [Bacteroidales bacterium]HPM17638.1 hypothetical protein [Bacteroidales bacterium]HPV15743.1 hypothetical protein [Bacteroidales bacterium]